MARKQRPYIPPNPSLNRRVGTSVPLAKIVVCCEGLTEKRYIDDYASFVGRQLVDVVTVGQVGVPSTVVAECIKRKNLLERQARSRRADSFDKNFSVWAVFDRDQHPCYDQAIHLCIENGIKLASSNPCVELWALLHFREIGDGHIERSKAQHELSEEMPTYDHSRHPYFNIEVMMSDVKNVEKAIINAKKLLRHKIECNDIYGSPTTYLHELINLINTSAKPPLDKTHEINILREKILLIESDARFLGGDQKLVKQRTSLYADLKKLAGE